MKVVYTAPNRAHHYNYAKSLHKYGFLHAFVSGFSRFSPRADLPEIANKLIRVDFLQNIYLASIKFNLPNYISGNLAYYAKIEQDKRCLKFIEDADLFLYYNSSGLIGNKYARANGKISVVEVVNSHTEYQEEILRDEFKFLKIPFIGNNQKEKERRLEEYHLSDYILAPSEFVKNSFIEKGFSKNKLLKVPYGFNQLSIFESRIKTNVDPFVVLYVGSVSVRKGLRYLIQAFNEFKHPNKKLRIVGPMSSPSGIEDLIIPTTVEFLGVLKDKYLENVYKSATVFCLPSLEDGFGLVLGEALSYGLPIITTKNTGASDIITDGVEGFIVCIRDSESIRDKFQLLSDNSNLYEEMVEASKRKSSTLKGWDQNGELLCSTLKDVYLNNVKN